MSSLEEAFASVRAESDGKFAEFWDKLSRSAMDPEDQVVLAQVQEFCRESFLAGFGHGIYAAVTGTVKIQ